MTRAGVGVCLAVALSSCASVAVYRGPAGDPTHVRGSVERVEYVESHSAMGLRLMLALAGLPEHVPVENGIDLYRVSYWTTLLGNPELASGLYAIPHGVVPRATVTWLNGTNPLRSEAPSMGSTTGTFVAAAFAGNGFVLLAPDYLGLGLSRTFHPYFDAEATADAAIDFMRAAEVVSAGLGVEWKPAMMLVGFSQGGYSTAVVQRALEKTPEAGVELRGAAALAPPLNLAEVTVPRALEGKSTGDTMYLAFIAHAYAHVHGQPLESLLTDDAARLVTTLFDGLHDADENAARLPKQPRELFRPEALAALTGPGASWFRDALKGNEAYRWAPNAPLRIFYGDRDVDVFPDDPVRGAAEMTERGGSVEVIPLGPYDHNGVAFHGVPRVQTWFMSLAPQP